jgi:hypothetical protein
MIKYLLFSISFFSTFLSLNIAKAQDDLTIKGIVRQVSGPLENVLVAAYGAQQSQSLSKTITDSSGRFVLSIPLGSLTLKFSRMGYQTRTFAISQLPNPFDVVLVNEEISLGEVEVVSKQQLVERKTDRVVVNVDAMVSGAGGSALDAIQRSPGISTDQNGGPTINGKSGTLVYVDGQRIQLSGNELQNYLKALPSSSISKLEIMANPPAKFDAAGGGGIINIITKKGKEKGLNSTVSLGYNQGRLARYNGNIMANYKTGSFNFQGQYAYNRSAAFSDLNISRVFGDQASSTVVSTSLDQDIFLRVKDNSRNIRLGIDFNPGTKTEFAAFFAQNLRHGSERSDNTSAIIEMPQNMTSGVKSNSIKQYNIRNSESSLNFLHRLPSHEQEISANASYIVYRSSNYQDFVNNLTRGDGSPTLVEGLQGEAPSEIDVVALRLDYSLAVSKRTKFSAGVKASSTQTNNLASYFNVIDGQSTPDYSISNDFRYRESVYASYLNLSSEIGKFSGQLGLRYEHTNSKGNQLGNPVRSDSVFYNNYPGFFPTLYLSYKPDTLGKHELNINFGRRINRPFFQDLNPFIRPLDKYTYYLGNPFLRASFMNTAKLSYTFNRRYTIGLEYSRENSHIGESIEINNGIYYSRPGNLATIVYRGASIDAWQPITKDIELNASASVTNIHSYGPFYDMYLDTRGTAFFLSSTLKWNINKSITAEVNLSKRTDITIMQFVSFGFENVNFGLQKKFNKHGTLRLGVNDIFYSVYNGGSITNLNMAKASYGSIRDTRQFVCSYSYSFGKKTASTQRSKQSAEEEKERIKS